VHAEEGVAAGAAEGAKAAAAAAAAAAATGRSGASSPSSLAALSTRHLRAAAALLGQEGLSDTVYTRCQAVLRELAAAAPSHRRLFVAELSATAVRLAATVAPELQVRWRARETGGSNSTQLVQRRRQRTNRHLPRGRGRAALSTLQVKPHLGSSRFCPRLALLMLPGPLRVVPQRLAHSVAGGAGADAGLVVGLDAGLVVHGGGGGGGGGMVVGLGTRGGASLLRVLQAVRGLLSENNAPPAARDDAGDAGAEAAAEAAAAPSVEADEEAEAVEALSRALAPFWEQLGECMAAIEAALLVPPRGVGAGGGVAAAAAADEGAAEQVRFRRYRFSPTGELGYSGLRGAVG
jgi:hypothetical protein